MTVWCLMFGCDLDGWQLLGIFSSEEKAWAWRDRNQWNRISIKVESWPVEQ